MDLSDKLQAIGAFRGEVLWERRLSIPYYSLGTQKIRCLNLNWGKRLILDWHIVSVGE